MSSSSAVKVPNNTLRLVPLEETSKSQIGDKIEYENYFEAKDFPVNINIPSVHIHTGEAVTVKIIRHSKPTNLRNSFSLTPSSHTTSNKDETKNDSIQFKYEANLLKMRELEAEIHELRGILEETAAEKEEITLNENNYSMQLIGHIQNLVISISLLLAIFFIFIAIFNLILPTIDSIFGFILSAMTGLLFFIDKYYRGYLNHG